MSMAKEDIERIVTAVAESRHKDSDKTKIVEWIVRALLAILVYLGMGLRADVDSLKQDVAKLTNDRVYSDRDMSTLRDFMAKPILGKTEITDMLLPLITTINKNTTEINAVNIKSTDFEKRLLRVEYLLQDNKSNKTP